jgi:hypothetical protein
MTMIIRRIRIRRIGRSAFSQDLEKGASGRRVHGRAAR